MRSVIGVGVKNIMEQRQFEQQLEKILLSIIRDYRPGSLFEEWEQARHLPYAPHQMVDILLSEGKLLIVVTDTDADVEAREEGLNECYRLMAKLYYYLVSALFPHNADGALQCGVYEGENFVVLVYNGPVPVVIEAIGRHVMPWVCRHYQHPKPENDSLYEMAVNVLNASFGNASDDNLLKGIIKRVMPLRMTYLEPLVLEAAPASNEQHASSASPNGQNEPSTNGAEPPRSGSGPQKTRTAPLPGYFDEPAER
jgi:hypothetical protein